MVTRVVKSSDIRDNTRLVLLNAITFRSEWQHRFELKNTRKELFYSTGTGQPFMTDMMNLRSIELPYGYYEPLNALSIELPFKTGSDYSLVVIIPVDKSGNLTQLVQNLDHETFKKIQNSRVKQSVHVKLPRIKLTAEVNVNDVFRKLHLTAPFEWSVFQVFKDEKLALDKAMQSVSVEIDERGARAAAVSNFATRSTKFTLDFFRKSFNANENTVMSPVSIQSTLALLYHVASENAATDMQRILELPPSADQLIPDLRRFLGRTNNNVLKMVSKVYHSQEELNPEFLPVLQEALDVQVESTDFTQKQQVANSVNQWVDHSTNGMITDLINPDDIRDDEQVILLNAITLNARWEIPFMTVPWKRTFHFVNGDHEIDMMTEMDDYAYAEVDNLKVLEIPYEEETDLSMVMIMPTKGSLEDLMKRFNMKLYKKLNSAMRVTKGNIEIPKFTINSKIPAKDILEKMGLGSAFGVDAFDVFVKKGAQLSELRQRAVINVFEGGTTAAAVTEGRIVLLSGPSYEFIADRPFVYLIRRQSTEEIFFIGHFSHHE
ncbi:hypothetical protein pipiens_020002 [Culex pipiens pipiens]|uniref:Serpin domain-containing protein n=1 Tax=Culex pipiens pipiens TaxID=38569 RepID=A0ABD1DPY1_CULPP